MFTRTAVQAAMDFDQYCNQSETAPELLAPATKETVIKRNNVRSNPLRRIFTFGQPTAGFPKYAPQIFIVGQTRNRIGERLRVIRWYEERIDALARDFAAARNIGGDNRPTACRGFQQTFWQAFAA